MKDPYFQALGLDLDRRKDRLRAKAALARAHDLRKFEIENYWKRANYFWLFQAAALTFLGLVVDGAKGVGDPLLLLPTGFGAVCAFAAWLTARGSKLWQENWESHVDALEAQFEGRLSQVIIMSNGPRPSVSRVNETFFAVILIAWLIGFLVIVIWPGLNHGVIETWLVHHRWISLVVLAAALAGLGLGGAARFSGVSISATGGRWTRSGERGPRILLRDTRFADAAPPARDRPDRY